MKYMGSKARFAKHILPIILENRTPDQAYVELFAGGMNVIDKVDGIRIASDNNKYLIAMWKSLVSGKQFTKDIPKSLYDDVRTDFNNQTGVYSDDFVGWIGFMGSANGRFFDGGYSGTSKTKTGTTRDYIAESIRNIEKQIPSMIGVEFRCGDYSDINLPNNSVIYLDIPYQGTKQYSTSKNFDHEKLWNWIRDNKQHQIFVSEYQAPDDFVCVWEMETKSSLSANGFIGGSKKSTEKLFKYV